jgi:tetratricopeptide (TPR) repeat protein
MAEPSLAPVVESSEIPSSMPETPVEQPASAPDKPKKKNNILKIILLVFAGLVILSAAGFGGIRWYEHTQFTKASTALDQKQWRVAEETAEKGLALQKTHLLADPDALLLVRARARYAQQKYDLATADFNQYALTHPKDPAPALFRSMIAYHQGHIDQAVKEGAQALKLDSHLAFPYAVRSYQAYLQNHLSDAEKDANSALENQAKLDASDQDATASALAYTVRGLVALWRYDGEAAKRDLDQAIALSPQQPDALAGRFYLSYLHYDRDSMEKEAAALKNLPQAPSKELDDHQKALSTWANGLVDSAYYRRDAALEKFTQAIDLDATRPEFYFIRATAYEKSEDLKNIKADYEKAIQINPDFAPAITAYAEFLYDNYEKVDMESQVKKVTTLSPQSYLSHEMKTMVHVRNRDWEKAIKEADAAISAQPGPVDGYLLRGYVYINQQEYEKAIADFKKFNEIAKTSTAGLYRMAMAYSIQHKYEDALKVLDQAAKIDPESMTLANTRAEVYLGQENTSSAKKELDKVFKVDPASPSALATRGMVELFEANPVKALSDFNRIAEFFPNDPNLMVYRAQALFANKDSQSALDELTKAVRINEKLVDIYILRSQIFMSKGDFPNAVNNAKKAIQFDPKNGSAYGILGEAETYQDKVEQGIKDLEQSVKLSPDTRYTYYVLATAQWYSGDLQSAKSTFDQYLKMKGKQNLQQIQSAKKAADLLGDIPPLKNGVYPYENQFKHFKIDFAREWIPSIPQTDSGIEFSLIRKDGDKVFTISISVTDFLDEINFSAVPPQFIAQAARQANSINLLNYKFIRTETIKAKNTTGIAVVGTYTNVDNENKPTYDLKQKIYLFTKGSRFVMVEFTTTPEDFDNGEPAADEIAKSFGFLD